MPATIEFFYDYGSPYAYIADWLLPGLRERTGAEIRHRPMLLGGLFKATGNASPITESCAPKRAYFSKTLQRWVAFHGLPFRMNPSFPINTITLMRMAVAAQRDGVFATYHPAVFKAMWVDGVDMGDPAELARVLTAAGLDAAALAAAAGEEEVKAGLKAATEEAARRGAFGAPTFFVGDEIFWGHDHMGLIEARIAGRLPAVA